MAGDIRNLLQRFVSPATAFVRDERGATMVEYGLMVSLIAIAAVASVIHFGTSLQGLYQRIQDDIVAAIQ